ncbi:MAG: hypothetical protein J5895_02760 [Alphaproteobacteria bacterium]|nr:hypothetical protein [Alphaproteobacteria bacterium]
MKTLSLDLTPVMLEKLFQDGTCLTFSYDYVPPQLNYEMNLKYEFKHKNHLKNAWVVSKVATLSFDSYPAPFQFFSNGVLIHNFDPTKDNSIQFKRIERMLSLHGYQIKEVYGPQTQFEFFAYDKFLRQISEYAVLKYSPESHLEAVKIPDKKTFVQSCFAKGQVLLTSSKTSKIDPFVRDYIALFDDGSFYVSEDYSNLNPINDPSIPSHFRREYPDFYFLKRRYVPQDYLAALDEKAKSFDWYLPVQKAVDLKTPKREFSETALKDVTEYMKTLFNGRKCISVTNPKIKDGDYIPEHDTYVLFDDGKLVISNALEELTAIYLIKSIMNSFPKMVPHTSYVPPYYIDFIYRELEKTQKTAREIYIEMLKQKAKHLKKELEITHHEALEIAAKMVGFKNFKEALKIAERNARYAIEKEQNTKTYALKRGKDYVMDQYKAWRRKADI